MNSIVKKTALGALAAATLGLSIAATATPAAAQWRHRHGHGGWGGPVAAGVVGGLALGALAARPYYYDPAPDYYAAPTPVYGGECYIQRQPLVDYYGNIIKYRKVRVCE